MLQGSGPVLSMKKNSLLVAFLATILALSIAPQAVADKPGAISTVRLNLQLKTSAPGTFVRKANGGAFVRGEDNQFIPTEDNIWGVKHNGKHANYQESVTKIVTTRYGNREFLEDLLAEGVIPDGSIRGWSIKMFDTPSGTVHFYLYKKGTDKVSLLPYIQMSLGMHSGVSASHLRGRETYTALTTQYNASVEGVVTMRITPVEGFTFELQGGMTGSSKQVELNKENFYPSKFSMPYLTGFHEETKTYIKGSMQISQGVVKKDVNPY